MLEVGDKVDRYIIESIIGKGGLATVYRVRHVYLNTPHAMKVLFLQGEKISGRLMLEGQIQATLKHPNIVRVSDVVEHNGAPVLIMDFVDGPTLKEWLQQQQPSPYQATVLFSGIIEGMAFAHAHGMIHRDMKPDNIMLEAVSNGLKPMIMDFGLAKVFDDDGGSLGHTRAGATMGTPEYMAPEQVRDSTDVDERSDIFSLGCIFYRLLTGSSAFGADDIVGVFNAVVDHDPAPPSDVQPGIPPALDKLVQDLLAKNREDRPQSCLAISQTLKPILKRLEAAQGAQAAQNLPNPTDLPSAPSTPPRLILGPAGAMADFLSHPSTKKTTPPPSPSPQQQAPAKPLHTITDEVINPATMTFFDENDEDQEPITSTTNHTKVWGVLGLGMVLLTAWAFFVDAQAPDSLPAPNISPTQNLASEPAQPIPAVTQPVSPPIENLEPKSEDIPAETAPLPPPPPPTKAVQPAAPAPAAKVAAKVNPAKTPPIDKPQKSPPTVMVSLSGDASSVWLTGQAGLFPLPGPVPTGVYKIKAWFSDPKPTIAGSVEIKAGSTHTVKCESYGLRCR